MIRRLCTWQTWAAQGVVLRLQEDGGLGVVAPSSPAAPASGTWEVWRADLVAELLLAHSVPPMVPWDDAVAEAVWRQVREALTSIDPLAVTRWGQRHAPERRKALRQCRAQMQDAVSHHDLGGFARAARTWRQRLRHLAALQVLAARPRRAAGRGVTGLGRAGIQDGRRAPSHRRGSA